EGLDQVPLKSPAFMEKDNCTIQESYVSILMLCMMDPYGKDPDDTKALYRFFQQHANQVTLGNSPESDFFNVDPSQDRGATYISKQPSSSNALALDPRLLLVLLNTQDSLLPLRLSRQVIRYCSTEIKRRDTHIDDETPA